MISDSDEEQQSDPGVKANDGEDSTDELDLIGDGHEEELLAESHALDCVAEQAMSTCIDYEYLSYEEALSYVLKHSARFQSCMSASERSQYGSEPRDWKDIKGCPDVDKWVQAAHEEVLGLLENGTWTLEQLPPGRTPIGSRWVFKLKRRSDGSIERYKARLVGKGFSQRPGMDYDQTFC